MYGLALANRGGVVNGEMRNVHVCFVDAECWASMSALDKDKVADLVAPGLQLPIKAYHQGLGRSH